MRGGATLNGQRGVDGDGHQSLLLWGGDGHRDPEVEQEQAMQIFGGVIWANRAASAKALRAAVAVPGLARGSGPGQGKKGQQGGVGERAGSLGRE